MLNILKSTQIFLILILFGIYTVSAGQIVDFQYAEFSQTAVSSTRPYDHISIMPQKLDLKTFEFPQACHNIQKLKNSSIESKNQLQNSNDINDYLQNLKQKFLQLMTVSQKITVSQSKIQHLNGLINKTVPSAPSKVNIQQLQILENQLRKISNNITLRSEQLQEIIESSNNQKQDSNRLQKQYKLEAAKDKIKYLKQLKSKVQNKIKTQGDDVQYQDYFDRLNKQYQNQSKIIDNISNLMKQKDRIAELKLEASNLQSSIQALNLYIQDLQSCYKEQKNIRTGFKDHQKIKQLVIELKRIKQKETGTNIYCDGVVKKLTIQIKNLLKLYEIISSCASDLEEKKKSLQDKKQQLESIRQQIKQLQSNAKIINFSEIHQKQRRIIDDLYKQMTDWKIKDYVHSPDKIQSLINQTEDQLQKMQNEVNNLSPVKPTKISSQVPQLIKQIKNLKLDYCKLYQKYDSLANKLWSQSYIYESQSKLLNKLKTLYSEEWERLIDHQKQFYNIKKQIENQI